jgi:hypothetical protein
MRRFDQPGDLPPTFETHWNRLGISNSPHLSEAQAQSRVCRHNNRPGCLTKGLPMPLPEPGLKPFMDDVERLAIAEQIYAEIGGEYDAA